MTGSILTERDIRRIERHARAADTAGFLHPVQRALLHQRGWLKMLAPRASGGAELPLPQVVRLEEAVAAVDGSMGWVLTLCAGAGWFGGFLAPELARAIIATPRLFLVPAAQVRIVPSWGSIGLRASASHSYRIDGEWVGKEYGFAIRPEAATADGPLYRFPFYSLAFVTLAANVAGMAAHFMRLARPCMARRRHAVKGLPLLEVPEVAALLRDKEQAHAAARQRFYAVLDRGWALVAAGTQLDAADMQAIQASSLELVAASRAAVDELYPYCGLYAAHEDSTINRVWRDFHTASQHSLLLP
jgi:alkylation response protein AidB-like acyl-CoA dehydrogenase